MFQSGNPRDNFNFYTVIFKYVGRYSQEYSIWRAKNIFIAIIACRKILEGTVNKY